MPSKAVDEVELFGKSVRLSQMPVTSPYAVGFFSSFARGWEYAWQDVQNRWSAAVGDVDSISSEEFNSLIEHRPIKSEWFPGMSTELAGRLIDEHDHAMWASQFDTSMVGQFLGAIAPSLLDPVSLATLPIGGFTRGAGISLLATLKANAVAGVKVAGASFVPEVASEIETYGEIKPAMLGLSLAAPIALPGILTAPVWGIGRAIDGRAARGAAENPQVTRFDEVEEIASGVENSVAAARTPPPPRPRSAENAPPAPTTRVQEVFEGYGTPESWLRDFAARDPRAIAYAAQHGIDPESPALRAFVDAEANRQAVVRTPEPAQTQARITQGLPEHPAFTKPKVSLPEELAGATPRYSFGGKQFTLSFESDIDRAAYIVAQKTPSKRNKDYLKFLAAAGLKKKDAISHGKAVRTTIKKQAKDAAPGGIKVKDVPIITERLRADGVERTIANRNQEINNEGQRIVDDPTLTLEARRQQIEEVTAQTDQARSIPREVTGEFDQHGFIDAVDAARMTAPVGDIIEPPPASTLAPPAREEDLVAFAREHGVPEEEIINTANLMDRIETAMRGCGSGS